MDSLFAILLKEEVTHAWDKNKNEFLLSQSVQNKGYYIIDMLIFFKKRDKVSFKDYSSSVQSRHQTK